MDESPERDALHSMMDLAKVLKHTSSKRLALWNQAVQTPIEVNGNHIWKGAGRG